MNKFIRILLLLALLSIGNQSIAHNSFMATDTTFKYKNAIKGKPTFLPFVGVGIYVGLSVGYERFISKHHGLEICSYYFFNSDEMGAQYHTICIMPAYKYFTVSENKNRNNFWVSIYLSYNQNNQTLSDQGKGSDMRYFYGIGFSVGKKINLSHNKRWFLDLGFGVSFNADLDESIFSATKWKDKYTGSTALPRPILQFGWKF